MKAAVLHAPGEISTEDAPDPTVILPTHAVIRVTAACIGGSDLWPYGGIQKNTGRIGHEFVGVIEELGSGVSPRNGSATGYREVDRRRSIKVLVKP